MSTSCGPDMGYTHFVICGLKQRKSQAGHAAKLSLETCWPWNESGKNETSFRHDKSFSIHGAYRCHTNRQRCLALETCQFHYWQIEIAQRTSLCLILVLIFGVFDAARCLSHNRLNFLRVFWIDLASVLGTHQHWCIRKRGLLETDAMAFDDCGGEYGHNICNSTQMKWWFNEMGNWKSGRKLSHTHVLGIMICWRPLESIAWPLDSDRQSSRGCAPMCIDGAVPNLFSCQLPPWGYSVVIPAHTKRNTSSFPFFNVMGFVAAALESLTWYMEKRRSCAVR